MLTEHIVKQMEAADTSYMIEGDTLETLKFYEAKNKRMSEIIVQSTGIQAWTIGHALLRIGLPFLGCEFLGHAASFGYADTIYPLAKYKNIDNKPEISAIKREQILAKLLPKEGK